MRRSIALIVAAGALLLLVGSAHAAKPPWAGGGSKVTKMKFKLADHTVAEGEDVTGSVLVTTGRGKQREPLAGVELSMRVDHVEVGTLTTGPDGRADVLYSGAAAGEHVMKLVYAGDDAHKRAKRAQGFEVGGSGGEQPPE